MYCSIIFKGCKDPKTVKLEYRDQGIDNYVFPVYTKKHVTDKQ